MIIAVDGPAGAGKGTLAKRLASHYGMVYLDTGALYRATGVAVLKNGGSPEDPEAATQAARNLNFDFRNTGDGAYHAFIDGQDVDKKLRTPEASQAASQVSAIPAVREALKQFQLDFISKHRPKDGALLDGRDIGTVICPDADLKFFLEADARVRAERRFKQLQDQGKDADFDTVYADTVSRDARDRGRKDAPMKPAQDAMIIDTSKMAADEVFEHIKALIDDAQGDIWSTA